MTLIANCLRNVMISAVLFVLAALVVYMTYAGLVYGDVYGADATVAGFIDLMSMNLKSLF